MTTKLLSYLSLFLLPPVCFLLIGIAGLAMLKRRPRAGKVLLGAMIALLWIFSMQPVGEWLVDRLNAEAEAALAAHPRTLPTAGAIVVLSAGRYYGALEAGGGDTPDAMTVERVRHAVKLHRQTGLPILLTGGNPEYGDRTLAELQADVLADYGLKARWMESAALTTLENARFSAPMLRRDGIDTVVLVTHGWHMPRARRAFERAGLKVVPAATGLNNKPNLTIRNFLPTADGLRDTRLFMHEIIGLAWYALVEAVGAGRK